MSSIKQKTREDGKMRVYFTCYRERAEVDLMVYHATMRTIDKSIDFDRVAHTYGDPGSPMFEWILVARNHWPDPLAKLEHVLAVSVFDVYAQSILFTLLMKSKGVPHTVYSSDWDIHFKDFNKWKRKRSTQNLSSLIKLLKSEFQIDVAIRKGDRDLVVKANKVRNEFIHQSSYFHIADPKTCLSWMKIDSTRRRIVSRFDLGELSRIVNEIIGVIDRAVVENRDLPHEILICRQQ